LVTALVPLIGYAEAARFAKEAVERGLTVRQLLEQKGLLAPDELARVLDLRAMTEVGVPGKKP
jgi:aspartate ammonia-lyase